MISVVVPLYNEELNVPLLCAKLAKHLPALGREYEVVLVNDGSSDATGKRIREAAQADAHVVALNLRRNYGQTAAMMAGFHRARGRIIVFMDGDLQNDPEDIVMMLAKLDEGYDVISGWRTDRKDNAVQRNLPSILANRLISYATGVRLHDFGCSLKVYRREILEHVSIYGEMHRFIAIYAVLAGARLAEVPVRHYARHHGRSKYGHSRVFKVLCDLLVVVFLQRYGQKPMYLFGACGAGAIVASALGFGLALFYKIFGHKDFITTPLPLISATMFLAGILCFLLGLLAELCIRIYHESQDKPTYLIDSRDDPERRPAADGPS